MNEREWSGVVAVMTANWPHQLPPKESLAKWGRDLAEFPADQVLTTVEVLYREGREFPPNGAQIRAKLVDLASDELDWSEAWELVREAGRKFGLGGRCPEALEWIEQQSLPTAIAAKRMGVREVTAYTIENESTARAQFRDTYREVVHRKRAGELYAGLPSAGLARLEGGERTSQELRQRYGVVNREDRFELHHPRKAGNAVRAIVKHIAPTEESEAA